jgi:purine-nucleoside phosphorylase
LGGGLNPALKASDAVVYSLCRDARFSQETEAPEESASIVSDDRLSKFVFDTLQAAGISATLGEGLTVDRIVTAPGEKQALGLRYGAQAIDMETFEIAGVCEHYKTPMTALRIVLDDARREIPDFNRAYGAEGRMLPAQMAAVMLVRPAVSARFLCNLRVAVKSLRKSLESIYGAKSVAGGPIDKAKSDG